MRAKEKLVGHENDPSARADYGRELARAGKHEQALAEYLWCFDNGRATPAYGGVRLSFLLADIQQLAPHCPGAIKALEERRDAAEARIRAGSNAFEDLADAVALNEHLNARERSLALYDELAKAGPIPTRMRFSFFLELKDQLRSAKRYADLLGLLDDPVKYVAGQIQQYESVRKMSASSGEKQEEAQDSTAAFLRSKTLQVGALVYEALLATDRGPEADKVAESLIAFDATGKTYAALIKLADRAGAAERVKALGERGLASLPEKEQAEVKKALARASKPK
jgi:hypothetical protein